MILDAARKALQLAAGETLVTVRSDRALRVAAGGAPGARAGHVVEVGAVRDGRAGVAVGSSLDDEALAATVRQAQAAASVDYPGLPGPAPARPHDGWDAETAVLYEDALRERLATLPEGAALAAGVVEVAAVSSRGLEATDRYTVARATVTVADGVVAQATATAVGALDLDALAARAAWLAERVQPEGSDPLSQGDSDRAAVLAPEALAPLLGVAGAAAFDGLAYARGEGPLAGRLGRRAAAAAINLSDSPRFASTLPRAFDAEGVPKAPLPLIQDGVAHAVVHDVRSGGGASTGHAVRPCGAAPPAPRNLVLVGGGAGDEDELAAPVDRGVFLPSLADVTTNGDAFTATAPAPLAIRDGRIGGRLAPARVEGTLFELLSSVEALTSRPRLVALARDWGVVCPAARVRELPTRS